MFDEVDRLVHKLRVSEKSQVAQAIEESRTISQSSLECMGEIRRHILDSWSEISTDVQLVVISSRVLEFINEYIARWERATADGDIRSFWVWRESYDPGGR